MTDKKYQWYKIASSENEINLSDSGIGVVEIAERKICIAKWDNRWFSFAYKCPHAGGLMSNGEIDATGNVLCPVHGYKFNMKNGRDCDGEGYFLKNWPVEKRPDGIYIGLEETGFFSGPDKINFPFG